MIYNMYINYETRSEKRILNKKLVIHRKKMDNSIKMNTPIISYKKRINIVFVP